MPPTNDPDEALNRMTKIVNSIMSRPETGPFHEPVDWRGLELWDYTQVIKKPMDLGTIKRKLERGQYATAAQCAADIRLVWRNCMTYNAPHSDFWLLAKSLSKRFEDRYRKVKAEFDVGEVEEEPADDNNKKDGGDNEEEVGFEGEEFDDDDDGERSASETMSASSGVRKSTAGRSSLAVSSPPQQQPLDAKAQLAANLLLLNGAELGHVIHTLEAKCPEALELYDQNKMEIIVDAIRETLFHSLCQYAASKASRHKKALSVAAAEKAAAAAEKAAAEAAQLAAAEAEAAAKEKAAAEKAAAEKEAHAGAMTTASANGMDEKGEGGDSTEVTSNRGGGRKRKTRSL